MVARICTRRGWTLQFWFDLPPMEQEFWIAYEVRRMEKVSDLQDGLTVERVTDGETKRSIDGTAYAITRLIADL